MPSSSATGSPRLGSQESFDEDLEGVVVVDAAMARGGAGGAAAQSVDACHRVGMRASLPTTWTACPPTSRKPPSVPGGVRCCSLKTEEDGTCSIHAIWGNVRLDSQGRPVKLFLGDARRRVVQSLPEDVAVLNSAVPSFVRELLEHWWFDRAWTDAVNFDLGERESQRFRRHLPSALQQDAKAYAEKKKKADAEMQSPQTNFFIWAHRFFTEQNECHLVRPLANVLGYLQAEDDVEILRFSPAPNDPRSAAVEGPDSFEILHAVAEGSASRSTGRCSKEKSRARTRKTGSGSSGASSKTRTGT